MQVSKWNENIFWYSRFQTEAKTEVKTKQYNLCRILDTTDTSTVDLMILQTKYRYRSYGSFRGITNPVKWDSGVHIFET